MQGKLPDWIHLPASAALPFGTFEAVLEHASNADAAAEIHQLQQQLLGDGKALSKCLRAVQQAVLRLKAPAELLPQLQNALQDAGGHTWCSTVLLSRDWPSGLSALCRVMPCNQCNVPHSIPRTNANWLLQMPCLTVLREGYSINLSCLDDFASRTWVHAILDSLLLTLESRFSL